MKKKVTTDLIEKYLDRHGWPKHRTVGEAGEEQGVVLTGWTSTAATDGHVLLVDPMVERDELLFTVKEIARAPADGTPSDRLSGLLMAIATINGRLIMGGFGYKPRDGELVFRLGIPIASDDLHYDDFVRCLDAITANVDRYAEALRDIIAGTRTSHDVLG